MRLATFSQSRATPSGANGLPRIDEIGEFA